MRRWAARTALLMVAATPIGFLVYCTLYAVNREGLFVNDQSWQGIVAGLALIGVGICGLFAAVVVLAVLVSWLWERAFD